MESLLPGDCSGVDHRRLEVREGLAGRIMHHEAGDGRADFPWHREAAGGGHAVEYRGP